MRGNYLPSIWLGEFRSKVDYDANALKLTDVFSTIDWIDDRLLFSRHPFVMKSYCSACENITQMRIDWLFAGSDNAVSINPAWTETAVCQSCGLNSRQRALFDLLKTRCNLDTIRNAYIAEQITSSYMKLKTICPALVGSEYFGPDIPSGKTYSVGRRLNRIRHEDLTALSFEDCQFDLAITQDVFEHIPNYRKAFAELSRILLPNGRLAFTIPFFYDLDDTRIRASIDESGIIHYLPPEIHSNPVSTDGALCFYNFGWDILDELRKTGFSDAFALMYWGPWQGHLGIPFFVFLALK